MHKRGFTIVELVVVMTIMAILLTLGLVSMRRAQATARDQERSADAQAIAKGLEARYTRGNPYATATFITQGAYPSTEEFLHAETGTARTGITSSMTAPYLDVLLPGVSLNNFLPPGTSGAYSATLIPMCTASGCTAEDATRINSTVTAGVYVYEPIDATKKVCYNTECVRFNIYYRLEDGTIAKETSRKQ